MRNHPKGLAAAGLGISLALLLGTSLLAYRSIAELTDAADWPHTHVVLERLETLRAEGLKADFDQFREAVRKLGLYWLVTNEPTPEAALDRG
jgi:hypothetical protein